MTEGFIVKAARHNKWLALIINLWKKRRMLCQEQHKVAAKLVKEGEVTLKKRALLPVERYLKGVDLPADKAQLEEHAKQNGAPEDVLSVLSRIQNQKYNKVTKISQAVAEAE